MSARVNESFSQLYTSPEFIESIDEEWMPWLLDGLDLGEHVLNLIAGPAFSVPALQKAATGQVTVAQLDQSSGDPVDPTRLPFPKDQFSAATAVVALHHIPSAELQDRALAELARVVRPGGIVAGLNPIDGPHFRRMNTDGASVPIDPLTFAGRLTRAGLVDVELTVWSFVRFVARVPEERP